MVLLPICSDLRNAYEGRDNGRFYPTLDRVQEALIGAATTPVRHMDPVALFRRRDDLHVQLAAVNDELQRRSLTRNGQMAALQAQITSAATELDPSDPTTP